ncbi:MAG: hypothetical protein R3E88_07295 [Myxococcota bacterium]
MSSMRTTPWRGGSFQEDRRRDLVLAVCHEIGNLVAAVRLEAHLLDDEDGPLGVARAAVAIEDLTARVGALLAQVRPLLEEVDGGGAGRVSARALLANLRDVFDERGAPGVRLAIEVAPDLPFVVGDPERINALLLLIALGGVEAATRARGSEPGRVDVAARVCDDRLEIAVCDDGPRDGELDDWRVGAQRGRVLALQLADLLLGSLGGEADVERADGRTCVRLVLAIAGDDPPPR